jgi:aconitate hydratase
MASRDSLGVVETLSVGGHAYGYFSLEAARTAGLKDIARLPFSLKVLLENLLRHEDGRTVTVDHIERLAAWPGHRGSADEVAFHPARIMMPDSSGLPLLADLAAMRDEMARLGGDPDGIGPVIPVDLIVDHSVSVDVAGTPDALSRNMAIEYERNRERFAFLKWARQSFGNLRVIPPGAGICHQINLEFLARVVWAVETGGTPLAYPDSLLGGDSHTPMINALGVFGWGVGGIEAASALLGQPVSVRVPEVVGCRLVGNAREGVTTTDVALTITEALRAKGVVQKFVEFHGPGLEELAVPDRASIANMAPEYGATMGFFPIDRRTLTYLTLSDRGAEQVALVEAYARAQGLWRDADTPEPGFTDILEVDLAAVEPCLAGPRRPQDRIRLVDVPDVAAKANEGTSPATGKVQNGDVVIAALTSCTNSSNPGVMIAAGLLARNAAARGLRTKPWVKTSFAPGSRVVADYLGKSGLQKHLDQLGFNVVGFGCTTCMGNSGPLEEAVAESIRQDDLVVAAVTSANRNFEGRAHPLCCATYLASPPLVVAYALIGTMSRDLTRDPLGEDTEGQPVRLADIWPSDREIEGVTNRAVTRELFRERYRDVFEGGAEWESLEAAEGTTFRWPASSSYILRPPFLDATGAEPEAVTDIVGARALLLLGDGITTDHISPVSAISADSLAGRHLIDIGVEPRDFNSFAARRVNHDVMMRGAFANVRLLNEMAPGTEGGFTRLMPEGKVVPVFEAARAYREEGVPLVVIAGKEYGTGSSRDWAAKATLLLGVRAVIAESFERIHRTNLVCMGVLPLQFREGTTRKNLDLDGSETFHVEGLADMTRPRIEVSLHIQRAAGPSASVPLCCRLDTAYEVEYFHHGGILKFALRGMVSES